jgi:hypothetical protein
VNFVRDRADLRWLPSRHHFALTRLVAYLVLRSSRPRPAPGLALVVDRDQSQPEHYAMSIWATLTAGCYVVATLRSWMPMWAAVLIAMVTIGLIVQIPLFTIGALVLPLWERLTGTREERHEKAISVAYMVLYLLASSYFVTRPGWVHYVAAFALLLFAVNAVAAVLMFLLRGAVRRLEQRCGV